ncbi:hypothetical protein R3X26_17730 [Vibrio sp. TH_r3]|uniref:hypothetical protein n=1 Tax=Vibrio sp. TH_r3 TaxID=3082084 RepID=UPI0029538242|nr:hypothetical protein [Vibrio sp. TH_r3]MDV7106240.1 hypothetical protein [Vibrio sp. TH_r3]
MKNQNDLNEADSVVAELERKLKEYIAEQLQRQAQVDSLLKELHRADETNSFSVMSIKNQIDEIRTQAQAKSDVLLREMKELKRRADAVEVEEKKQSEKPKNNNPNNVTAFQQSSEKKDNTKRKVVDRIHHLEIQGTFQYGTESIGILVDGLSGVIQVTEGDLVGTMRITKINSTKLQYTDTITGELYEIRIDQ